MSIEAHLAENTAALKTVADLIAKFLAAGHAQAPAIAKAEAAPAKKAEPKAEAAAPAAPVAPVATASNEDAYLVVKEQLLKLIASKGNEAGVALLAQFGAKNGKQLPAEKYPEVLAAIEKAAA